MKQEINKAFKDFEATIPTEFGMAKSVQNCFLKINTQLCFLLQILCKYIVHSLKELLLANI